MIQRTLLIAYCTAINQRPYLCFETSLEGLNFSKIRLSSYM